MHRILGSVGVALASLVAAPSSLADVAAMVARAVDPIVEAEMKASGMPGAAFVFVQNGNVVYEHGYGVSDLALGTKVDPARTVWPIASITKVVTSMAVLQLVDDGRVELDTDVNRYLKRLQVPARGYAPLTLRHLLSHTAGLDELPGRQFDGKSQPDLAALLRDRIVRYRAPGQLTAYSTYGILLAAVLLEDVTGEAYADYVRDHVLRPAGMASGRVMSTVGDERSVATPYRLEDGRAEAQSYEWYVSAPASSIVATAEDMGRLLLVHLGGGTAGGSRILSRRLTGAMHTQQATIHSAIPGWSLGMQMDHVNGRVVVEHGGDIGGFSALFVLVPEEKSGFFIVNHGEGDDLRFKVKDALLDALYPPPKKVSVPLPRAEDVPALREYAGQYLSTLACRSCAREEESVFTISVEPEGRLSLWGQTWIQLRRDLFVRDDGKRMLGFARGAHGAIVAVSAGSWRVADRLPDS